MPAKSKAQKTAMCMALAARKGDLEVSKLKGAALEIYKSEMTNKEIEDFTILKENINNKKHMKAKNIQEFFGTLQQSTVEAWKKHLKVSKKSEHETLNDFYEDIIDVVDSLIEDYMSIHGKVEDYVNLLSEKEMTALEYLETLREFTRESADELLDEDDTELFSDVDNILSVMDTAIYKLKELEGGKDDKKTNESFSLKSYLTESLEQSNINEEMYRTKKIEAEYDRDFLKIGPLDIDKYDFVMIDEPLGAITLITTNELNSMAEEDEDFGEEIPSITKLKYGQSHKYYDTIFVKI